MYRTSFIAVIVAVAVAGAPVLAQTATETNAETPVAGAEGAFDRLSPGGQKISRALVGAQGTAGSGGPGWTLDEIAAAKQSGSGWGEVFKQMQADGLVTQKNLGQVISGANREARSGATVAPAGTTATGSQESTGAPAQARRPVTITLGNGQTVFATGRHGGQAVVRGTGPGKGAEAAKTNRGFGSGERGIVSAGGNAVGSGASHVKGGGPAYGRGGAGAAGIVSAAGGAVGAGTSAGIARGNGSGQGHAAGKAHGRGK